MSESRKILLIDNYDSFVHNLARYFRQLGCATEVVRNDAVTLAQVESLQPSAIVISPGPGTPNEAGISLNIIEQLAVKIPILGICLGHQAIVQALGGQVLVSHQPMHGKASEMIHWGSPMFDRVPSPFNGGRYHSLIANRERLPGCLQVTARTADFTVMAVEHRDLPIVGLQFHPESVLTEHGYTILQNFLRLAGLDSPHQALEIERLQAGMVQRK